MVQHRIKIFKKEIPDDDVYDDALRKLQDCIEDFARLNNNTEAAETLQQVVLTRQFLRKRIYSEVEDRAERGIRQIAMNGGEENRSISQDKDENKPSDQIPPIFQRLLRVLNRANAQELFDDDYGYVKQSNITKILLSEIDENEEEASERTLELSELVSSVYQSEYNNTDEEYRKEVEDLLKRLIKEPDYENNPYPIMQNIIKEYKMEIHKQKYGWPDN